MSDAHLKQALAGTLSLEAVDARTRKDAERVMEGLKNNQSSSGDYVFLVLKVVETSADLVRQAAAVHFKTLVKEGWDKKDEDSDDGIVLTDVDREGIKSRLVDVTCKMPHQIQAQLCESINLIAKVDYYENWNFLLPDLVGRFGSSDPATVTGVLKTADSIFENFRDVERSDGLHRVIVYTLDLIQAPITNLCIDIGRAVVDAPEDKPQLLIQFEQLRLICSIFYSLNYQDLPEYFEDNMNKWMEMFATFLQYKNGLLTDDEEEQKASPIDMLQASIIDILVLYANKDEKAFLPYLPTFAKLVWNLLLEVSQFPKQDSLAAKSIKFLGSLVEKAMHKKLFDNQDTLRQIVLQIVIPNLSFRESDEERFMHDPHDYIVTEVEGSDSESRRKCSQDLLRSMCRQFEAETTAICTSQVGSMLAESATDPDNNWRAKDAAIHLMIGISVKKGSFWGVSELIPGVDVLDLFLRQILPELQDTNHVVRPVVKSASLNFVSVFRNQFTRAQLVQLMPMMIAHLASPVVVVHTFAAYSIERILVTKEKLTSGAEVPKFGKAELQPFIQDLFKGLFAIIENVDLSANGYAMKCAMRSLATANEDITFATEDTISRLAATIVRIGKDPTNSHFNHYLFESIAILVRSVCSKKPSETVSFEKWLGVAFNKVLQEDIAEFTPYVFQIMAQLLEFQTTPGLSETYQLLFASLLQPESWKNAGNRPALTRLMQAYIRKDARSLVPYLDPILGVFQMLASTGTDVTSAFDILFSSVVYFPQDAMKSYMPKILTWLLMRLTSKSKSNSSVRYTPLSTTFFALLIGKYSPEVFIGLMNGVQDGLSTTILSQVWAPQLKNNPPRQKLEAKIQVVGATMLLCECPAMITDIGKHKAWQDILEGLVMLLTSATFQPTTVSHVGDKLEVMEMETGFDAQFSKLSYATKEVEDYFADIPDPSMFFVRSLHGLLSQRRSQVLPLIEQKLATDPELTSAFESLFKQAGFGL